MFTTHKESFRAKSQCEQNILKKREILESISDSIL